VNDEARYQWGRRDAVLQRAQISALYHRKRERAFDLADRLSKAVAVIGASAAFAAIGEPVFVKGMAAMIAITSALSLVFGFSERGRRHSDLAHRFCLLEADITQKGRTRLR
jgi:NaMN:DMB phosphoribosyltransferase